MNLPVQPIYLDLPTAAAVLSLSESTFQKLEREDETFPKARKLSGRRVGYLYREIQEWAEGRPVSDFLPPSNTGARKGKRNDGRPSVAEPKAERTR